MGDHFHSTGGSIGWTLGVCFCIWIVFVSAFSFLIVFVFEFVFAFFDILAKRFNCWDGLQRGILKCHPKNNFLDAMLFCNQHWTHQLSQVNWWLLVWLNSSKSLLDQGIPKLTAGWRIPSFREECEWTSNWKTLKLNERYAKDRR